MSGETQTYGNPLLRYSLQNHHDHMMTIIKTNGELQYVLGDNVILCLTEYLHSLIVS